MRFWQDFFFPSGKVEFRSLRMNVKQMEKRRIDRHRRGKSLGRKMKGL